MTAVDTLKALGFTEEGQEAFEYFGEQLGLSHNGDYKILGSYRKGDVYAVFEQNVSPDTSGGVEIIMKHPPVLVIEGPKGRSCIPNYDDPDYTAMIPDITASLA